MPVGLLIDTSTPYLRVALARDDKVIASREEHLPRAQSELLVPRIKDLLTETGLDRKDLSYVVVGKGPGSYTGVRMGLAVAKVSSLVLGIPLYTVSSLSLYAVPGKTTVCLMDARAKRSYMGIYLDGKRLREDAAVTNDEVLSLLKEHPEYAVGGATEYLGLQGSQDHVFLNLLKAKDEEHLDDCLSAKPVYLKEEYAVPNLR